MPINATIPNQAYVLSRKRADTRRIWERAYEIVSGFLHDYEHRYSLMGRDVMIGIDRVLETLAKVIKAGDPRMLLIRSWESLLEVYGRGRMGAAAYRAREKLALALAEMLCSLKLNDDRRSVYMSLLQTQMRYLNRNLVVEGKPLEMRHPRFRTWMTQLRKASAENNSPVLVRPENRYTGPTFPKSESTIRQYTEPGDMPKSAVRSRRYFSSCTSESQLMGNFGDHWRMRTSHS